MLIKKSFNQKWPKGRRGPQNLCHCRNFFTLLYILSSNVSRGQFYNLIGAKPKWALAWSWTQKMPFGVDKKLHLTLPVNLTRSYAQLLLSTLKAVHQKDQRKSPGAKATHKMLLKLTSVKRAFSQTNKQTSNKVPFRLSQEVSLWRNRFCRIQKQKKDKKYS